MRFERMRVEPRDRLNADNAFMAGLMRKPRRAGQVANRIDSRLAGLAKTVHHHMGPFHFDLGVFKADIFGIADDADRGDDAIDGYFLLFATGLDGHGHVVVAFFRPPSRWRR